MRTVRNFILSIKMVIILDYAIDQIDDQSNFIELNFYRSDASILSQIKFMLANLLGIITSDRTEKQSPIFPGYISVCQLL